jgi:site-specific DNA-methyltransferase (adenine-specific)
MKYKNLGDPFKSEYITLYNCDCMELLKQTPDNYYSLCICDPPYGLGNRLSDGGGKLKNTPMAELYRNKDWDVLPNKIYWKELFRITKNQIIFGANYFLEYLSNTRGFVCWDKKQSMPTLSACELIWTSFDKPAKIASYSSMDLNRFHPTQKPITLYKWLLHNYAKEGDTIFDSHLGSGSSMIAAHEYGFKFVGCEIDQDYFNASVKRFKEQTAQQSLFKT